MARIVLKNNDAVSKINKMFRDCGFPNVKLVVITFADESGHNAVEEKILIVNGYIFHSYNLFQIIIKKYVKKFVDKYKNLSNCKINMELQKDIKYLFGAGDKTQFEWQRIRWEQVFVLTECLVKSLRFSNNIDEDLDEIFDSDDCTSFELFLAEAMNIQLMQLVDIKRIQEYDTHEDRFLKNKSDLYAIQC